MIFRVLTENTQEAITLHANDLKNRGFSVIDLLTTDIVENGTNKKVGEAAAVVAKGGYLKYQIFKIRNNLNEIMWEGVRTINGRKD